MCGGEAGNGGREGSIIALSIVSIIVSCPETTSVQYGDLRGPFSKPLLLLLASCPLGNL